MACLVPDGVIHRAAMLRSVGARKIGKHDARSRALVALVQVDENRGERLQRDRVLERTRVQSPKTEVAYQGDHRRGRPLASALPGSAALRGPQPGRQEAAPG